MATVLLDFDSTLVPHESLEVALSRALDGDAERVRELETLTRRGMEGELTFAESLRARLAIASPRRDDLLALGREMVSDITHGARELVDGLHVAGHHVRIVSGAFREVLLAPAAALGISETNVHAVRARWTADGGFDGLIEDGFERSKVQGAAALAAEWSRPIVAVGDGATDLALARDGIADHFIAFTGHVRRDFLDHAGVPEASTMDDARHLLTGLLP